MKRSEAKIVLPKMDTVRSTDRFLVAVSGGRDSIALLHLLVDAGFKNLVVIHLNHQLRGRTSDTDAAFVEKIARGLDLKWFGGSADVAGIAKREKISVELAGRRARHLFFKKAARKFSTNHVFVGHHADDLVETLLINLFRGTGLAGLSSLRETSEIVVGGSNITLLRPLLHIWREQIDVFVKQRRLSFREDASNADTAPLRNRIRRRVIPYLERTLERNIRQSLWRCAMIAAEEGSPENPDKSASGDGAIIVAALAGLSIAAQRRTIASWLRENQIPRVGFDLVERVRSLVKPNASNAKVNLPDARHVRRRAKKLFIE